MIRILKFRGKSLDGGKLHIGGYFYNDKEKIALILNVDEVGNLIAFQVDPLSVKQFTGMKDNTGTDIYEGDAVNCWGGEDAYGVWEFSDSIQINDFFGDVFKLSHFENLQIDNSISK